MQQQTLRYAGSHADDEAGILYKHAPLHEHHHGTGHIHGSVKA